MLASLDELSVTIVGRMSLQVRCQSMIWVVIIEPVSCTSLSLCSANYKSTKIKYQGIQDFGLSQVFQVVLTAVPVHLGED